MKKIQKDKTSRTAVAEMRDEYRLDYAKARPNRFAGRMDKNVVVVALDPDVAEIFDTPETVNRVLRALIGTMPNIAKLKPDEKSTA
jgi:hypothetical protein